MAAKADSLQDVKSSLQNDWKSSTGLITDGTSQSTEPSEESTPTSDGGKTEELNQTKRERWNKKIDFLIACTGYSIGLGNVWRFPYLCYKNGGGAFLLPYFISVFVVGIPLFFLEVSLGQLMSRGGIEAWNICPLLKGIGYSSIIIAFLINMYYNIVMAWTLFYLFASFTSTLPWSVCSGFWNTPNCDENTTDTVANHSRNSSLLATDPVTEYWERRVLGLSESIEDLGNLRWDLSLCLLLAWIIIFLCIFRGLKATSQVTYFTALSPYVLLIILLGRAVSLPGATTGLTYFISPNWTRLGSYTVWSDAGTQIFFSYAISIRSLPALGSFNDFHHNSFRDCFLFAGINTLASMLSGCVIFATLGYMSYTTGVSIHSVADSGPGLAFVAYPKALSTLPVSPLWSVLFFVMLFLLGLDSQFVSVEGFVTALADIFPRLLNKLRNRQIFMMITCLLSFLIGLPMVTEGGMYIFQIFDFYIGSRIILVVAIFECIVVGYIYDALSMENRPSSLKRQLDNFFDPLSPVCAQF
nr:unnamed protein product [Spirometra erinaceieuropaei]